MSGHPKMNPEFKARWVGALRSWEYRQMAGRLRDNDGFCCLGVACDLIAPAEWKVSNPWVGAQVYTFRDHRGVIDSTTSAHIGLSDYGAAELVRMNEDGKSFAEIADWIEVNL